MERNEFAGKEGGLLMESIVMREDRLIWTTGVPPRGKPMPALRGLADSAQPASPQSVLQFHQDGQIGRRASFDSGEGCSGSHAPSSLLPPLAPLHRSRSLDRSLSNLSTSYTALPGGHGLTRSTSLQRAKNPLQAHLAQLGGHTGKPFPGALTGKLLTGKPPTEQTNCDLTAQQSIKLWRVLFLVLVFNLLLGICIMVGLAGSAQSHLKDDFKLVRLGNMPLRIAGHGGDSSSTSSSSASSSNPEVGLGSMVWRALGFRV